MHSFPPLQDLAHLSGQLLYSVEFGPYQVSFSFEDAHITAAAGVDHVEPDGTSWAYECESGCDGPSLLHRLVNKTVNDVQREDLRLTLAFEDGAILHIRSDHGPYEAGQVTLLGKTIVF